MKKILFKIVGAFLNLTSLFFPRLAVNWAIKLFSTPQRHPIRQKEMEFLGTAQQVRGEVAGLPIVEYHWGDANAPLVLLSYGWEYNAGRWRHFVPTLVEAGFRVIAYDPAGHGLAADGEMNVPRNAMIIRDLIKRHGRPEVIIAHSFGGSSTVFALHELPDWYHPHRMVIMASFSYAPRIIRDYANILGMKKSLFYSIVRTFEQRVNRPLIDFDFARMTSDFSHIRGLLVHSPSDAVTPFAEAQRYFNFWEGAALFAPDEGGHHLGTPAITEAILKFAIDGTLPPDVEIQDFPLPGRHDLARHFSGM